VRTGEIIMMTARRRNRLFWGLVVVLVAGLLLAAHLATQSEPGPFRITVSKETTHILGPVNEDGTVNYLEYLNTKHSKGVTKANNAAIPLIRILGPDFLPKDAGRKICEILKIELPSEDKEYFTPLSDYIDKTLNDKDADAWKERDDLAKATTSPWKAKEYPEIAGWLEANDAPLNATLLAVQRTGYYMPGVSSSPDENLMTLVLPSLRSYMDIGKALVARAMLRFDSGDTTGAWADLMAARHLARRVGSGYWLVENLVALAIETQACVACRAVAGSGKLTGPQAQAFLADMQHLGPVRDMVEVMDEGERFGMLDSVMMLARTTSRKGLGKGLRHLGLGEHHTVRPNVRSLNWDKILLRMNPWYDSFVAAARRKTFKARTAALGAHDRRFEKFGEKSRSFPWSILGGGNDPTEEIGNILITLLIQSVSRAVVLRDRATAEGDLSVVAMALAAYRAEKKAYPDKLSQLSPGYLKKVPDDLFVDKPFGYERTDKGYVLYSVGENMKFGGGKVERKDDIVVRVE